MRASSNKDAANHTRTRRSGNPSSPSVCRWYRVADSDMRPRSVESRLVCGTDRRQERARGVKSEQAAGQIELFYRIKQTYDMNARFSPRRLTAPLYSRP